MDGIILTIPNDQVFEATQYALEHDIPVLVFNTGLDYAKRLGLTRVLQDDQEAATMLGQELRQRGYERPLVIQLGDLDNTTFYHRFDSLQNVLDHQAVLLPLHDYNNTAQPLIQVRDTFLSNGTFDSIVSLGGSVSHMNQDDFSIILTLSRLVWILLLVLYWISWKVILWSGLLLPFSMLVDPT